MTLRVRSMAELPEAVRRLNGAGGGAPSGAKPAKYRNTPTHIDGKRFSSKLEGRCYEWLKLRRVAGEVRWFIRQPRFELPGGVVYVADFLADTCSGTEVIDAKGRLLPDCKNKLKQMRECFGIEVILWTDKREALAA